MADVPENEDGHPTASEEHELLQDEVHNGILDKAHSPEISSLQFSRPSLHNLSGNNPPSNSRRLKSPPSMFQRYQSFSAMIVLLLLGLLSAIAQHSLFS